MAYKLGSLFDGSGGFPLAGAMCGIEPVWAAEVEPYPIAVTRSRFPNMEHLGDISKINGAEIEPVDIITFGSPCQDLSVAGLRRGLKHEAVGDEETTRSGLFMEAVRIIKEMRSATNGEFPKVCLWENVPGAFSSNSGNDFRVVCEELIKIIEPRATMPSVPQKGWPYADSYCGDGWSLAYRVFDAQYWGVPQRRRRIHLCISFVADTGAQSARAILFERNGLRGYFEKGRTPWQDPAADAQDGSGATDPEGESQGGRVDAVTLEPGIAAREGGHIYERVSGTLRANAGDNQMAVAYTMVVRSGKEKDANGRAAGKGALVQTDKASTINTVQDQYLFQPTAYSFDPLSSNSMKSKNPNSGCREVQVSKTLDCFDPNPSKNQGGLAIIESIVLDDQGGSRISVRDDGKVPTLRAESHGNVPAVIEPAPTFCLQGNGIDRSDNAGCNGKGVAEEVSYTLNTLDRHAVATPICLDRAFFNQGKNAAYPPQLYTDGTVPPLVARGPAAVAHSVDEVKVQYIVRRLTPTECARLQGFADWWGQLEALDSLSQKDYQFWLNVRKTHAALNGKTVKDYTPSQMVAWYNKLQTDSAEYKMWGNGIALPPALYCMQGIADALTAEDDSWMM